MEFNQYSSGEYWMSPEQKRTKFDSNDHSFNKSMDNVDSRYIKIKGKKYFIDLKKGRNGFYVKICECDENGDRVKITMELEVFREFQETISEFVDIYLTLEPNKIRSSQMVKIKETIIRCYDRRYFIELKEGGRGRYVQIAVTFPPPNKGRQQMMFPAEGLVDLRDALSELLVSIPQEIKDESDAKRKNASYKNDYSVSTSGSKKFHFEVFESQNKKQLRITEKSPTFSSNVTVPIAAWKDFLAMVKQRTDNMDA